jgi:uncharacterized protein YyaL (SSP411 family)
MTKSKKPNKLVHSSSPYLKQHAYNPVQWYPWGQEALQKAKNEDKPIIISIGYSACHWCHVMERESFENHEIAEVMNAGFICIKVDREERPDVDQVYMEAIQMMGIGGGWPLNVFAMPDQKPFYGGTYFQPRQWLHILKSIAKAFEDQRHQLEDSANGFARSLGVTDSEKYELGSQGISTNPDDLSKMVNSMKMHFDRKEGGLGRAPKFPNPSIWNFLLTANHLLGDQELQEHIDLTLNKMANGGIYDHIGGGFARYSVDEKWFAPHFEKMLYDNGQLISLYSRVYQATKTERFKEVVYESIEFVKRELTSPDFGFYAALDADSEGEEGNFYIWSEKEVDQILGEDADIIKKYYNITSEGNWERGKNILYTSNSLDEFALEKGIESEEAQNALARAKKKLLKVRSDRERPGLDNKILAGWNGLMLRGLVDAFHAFGESEFLELALKNAQFIQNNLLDSGKLLRSHRERINGYLEDYALVIDAFIALYQATFDEQWLDLAMELTDYSIENFYDKGEELFYFTDKNAENLIARKKEVFDNVIPASNSVMAQNVYWLGILFEREEYIDISKQMLSKISPLLTKESRYVANWGTLYALFCKPTVEIAIVGKEYKGYAREIQKQYKPHKLIVAASDDGELPLLQNRKPIDGRTTLYVCFNKSCKLPVHSVKEALQQIEQ